MVSEMAGTSPDAENADTDVCRQQLLAALSINLSDEAFSWRRKPSQEDALLARQRSGIETALEDIRRRMEIACGSLEAPGEDDALAERLQEGSAPPVTAQAREAPYFNDDEDDEEVVVTTDGHSAPLRPGDLLHSEEDGDTPRGISDSPEPHWRQQFLHLLAAGLDGMPEVELSGRKGSCEGIDPTPQGSTSPEPRGATQSPAPTLPEAPHAGPGFFGPMEDLQKRLAERRMSNKVRASFPAASGADFLPPSTPSCGSRAVPAPAEEEPLAAEGPETSGFRRKSSSFGSINIDRPASESPKGAEARRRMPAFTVPADGNAGQVPAPRARSAQPQVPLRDSECRRPRTGGSTSPRSCVDNDADAPAPPPEAFQTVGDDLLQWAEEVLRKAKESKPTVETGDEFGSPSLRRPPRPRERTPLSALDPAFCESPPFYPPQPPCSSAPPAPPPLTPRAKARRRRAEELRDKMRRLTEESERERQRLTNDEEAQRRRIAEEEERWRNRVNCAAEEFRANFSKWSSPFVEPTTPTGPPSAGASPRSARQGGAPPPPRSGNVPPPPREDYSRPAHWKTPDPSPVVESKRDAESAWANLEALLETGSSQIRFSDIPWPSQAPSASITGVAPGDSAASVKRKLAVALRRWHPDKWRRILDHVPDDEQTRVMERVKAVAQRLLEEKAKLATAGRGAR
mmetsp:Transcript_75865/g.180238  ORF Transcript_75865/g.180238 Transcript_75865/m.180238 type:complete len:686 (-) Transcript_75865:39-2096(-)